jgi:orotate phosphoribosyltransferase
MGDVRIFRRDFDIAPEERVLIVDDILTTGNSIRETMRAVGKLGGVVIGIGVLIDRSVKEIDFGLPLFSCLRVPTTVYAPEECPLCAANIPLVKPGRQS